MPRPHRHELLMTPVQIAAILGLESLVQAMGLILVCPRCLQEGDPSLQTENDHDAPVWKIDCGCRKRRIPRTSVGRAMDADGELIASADGILTPMSLAVRCPNTRCIQHPLEIERTPGFTRVRCRCAKTTLHPPTPTVH